jgi:hypothetical protein
LGGEPLTDQPGSVLPLSIVQFTSVPAGKLSVTLRPVAVVSLALVRVTVNPICDPAPTLPASAVLVMETSAGTVAVGVGVGVKVAEGVGVGVNVAVAVAVGVKVAVAVGVNVAVAVGVNVAVAVGVGVKVAVAVGVGLGAAGGWSAPIAGGLSRGSLSKSLVMPEIVRPAPTHGLLGEICRSPVAALPFGLMYCESTEMLLAS